MNAKVTGRVASSDMTKTSTATTPRTNSRFHALGRNRKTLLVIGAVLVLVWLIILAIATPDQGPHRTETYKDISGAAGLNASVDYDCASSCENKFDFNVYLFTQDGRQTNVVRPDEDGRIRLAMPEGEYVMLIGKQFGKDKKFPQEPVTLKKGRELKIKLQYGEG